MEITKYIKSLEAHHEVLQTRHSRQYWKGFTECIDLLRRMYEYDLEKMLEDLPPPEADEELN